MLIDRIYKEKALSLFQRYPVLCILGPRQCGKTTFAKQSFPDCQYLDLELPSDVAKLSGDPELFLRSRKRPVILDEVQRMPELFPIVRALVDQNKTHGQYIFLGSMAFSVVRGVSESLAGRVGILDLAPFSVREVGHAPEAVESLWLKGGFPDAFLIPVPDVFPWEWYENYSRTFIERDLPAMGIGVRAPVFRKLWTMLAHYHGNVLNMSKLAGAMGIAVHTVERYLDILEEAFLIRRLSPYFANTKKRLVKAPKIYLRDSGLLHYFLKIAHEDDLLVSPHRGESFEGFVLEQLGIEIRMQTPLYDCAYLRTSQGLEIDIVCHKGERVIPIEIKAKLSPDVSDIVPILQAQSFLPYSKAYIVGFGNDRYPLHKQVECIGLFHWVAGGCYPFWAEEPKDK